MRPTATTLSVPRSFPRGSPANCPRRADVPCEDAFFLFPSLLAHGFPSENNASAPGAFAGTHNCPSSVLNSRQRYGKRGRQPHRTTVASTQGQYTRINGRAHLNGGHDSTNEKEI